MTILRPRDLPADRPAPALLYGYGGYGLSMDPNFNPLLLAWLELGCAYVIATRQSTPDRLAIQGASNGGLLMGAALTQRPDLFRAVAADVGVLNSLRAEHDDNGAFNVTESGSTEDPEQFAALHAYSPVHRVRDGVPYPAVLLSTGANDPRVNPYHSLKMAARLQAATSSALSVLLRTTDRAGHGMGSGLDEVVSLRADQ